MRQQGSSGTKRRRGARAPEDVVLLCCDGLTGMAPDARIAEIIRGHPGSLQSACDALVSAANHAGGVDNITCVLVQAHA